MSTVMRTPQQACFKMGSIQLLQLTLPTSECFEYPGLLDDLLSQAPDLFSGMPVIIDLTNMLGGTPQSLKTDLLIDYLRHYGLVPVCFQSKLPIKESTLPVLTPEQLSLKREIEAYPFQEKAEEQPNTVETEEEPATEDNEVFMPDLGSLQHTKIINSPVRSGQQVYARNADLLILSAVSEGAEVLADGNIYAYAPLRGRAAAGILGNTNARIFTLDSRAEMLSVAGIYVMPEDFNKPQFQSGIKLWLDEDGKLELSPLASAMPEKTRKPENNKTRKSSWHE